MSPAPERPGESAIGPRRRRTRRPRSAARTFLILAAAVIAAALIAGSHRAERKPAYAGEIPTSGYR